MSVTKHPTLKDHWIIVYYPLGHKKDPKTGKRQGKRERIVYGPRTYEQAKIYERELIQAAKNVTIRLNPSFSEIFIEFCGNYKLAVAPSTFRDFESAWNAHLLPFFGSARFTQIQPSFIDQFKKKSLEEKKLKHKTVNKLLSYVSAIITWASDPQRAYSKKHAIEMFGEKQIQPPPKIIPTPDEVKRLIDHIPRDNRGALCTVMYYAGLRIGDANSIKKEHVNLEAEYMIVIGKGSKQRLIPLTPELKAVIEPRLKDDYFEQSGKKGKRWENNSDYLWPNLRTQEPFDDIQKVIDSTCKRLGINKRITHHTLRHSFCTHMLMQGASTRTVQVLAGHSSTQVTEKYLHLIPEFLQREMGRIAKQEEVPAPKPADQGYPPELQSLIDMMVQTYQQKSALECTNFPQKQSD